MMLPNSVLQKGWNDGKWVKLEIGIDRYLSDSDYANLFAWFADNDLRKGIDFDYQIPLYHSNRLYFYFKEPKNAVLFKLANGGMKIR